ncbi:YadA-like family protein [Megasphaera vaginalis (ex Bordigoni et al. 2020)]|uniref:YadA-like family protein n=1 Tax=Megasphaera vaginalis (ex Bordigoni et al. 2020) TaxID=2045301 RepID=UPI000C7D0489|nr:YadA-like family protein [Megasphaera vaginalis (ex Bordigoni et al. 2020)]
MTKYGNTHRTLSLRILCVLLLGTCLLGGHGTVSAIVDTMTPTNTNKNISVNTNSGSVELTLSGLATEPWQTALGDGAEATGGHATAIGADAKATAQGNTALGDNAKAEGTSADGMSATAIGAGAYATRGGSSLGNYAYARGDNSVAFGSGAKTGTESSPASGTEAIAIGYTAKAQKKWAIAIGSGANADGESATVLGYKAKASGKNALALGYNATASLENSVAIGYNSSVGAANTVSFGSSGATRRLMYVSAGESDTDAANFGQLIRSAGLSGSKLQFYTQAANKAFEVDLSSLSGAGGAVIGGGSVAYTATGNGTLKLKNGVGSTIASIAGFTDKYTTGVELVGNTVTFTRNDGGTYSFELPASAGSGGMASLKFAGDDGPVITKTDGQKMDILGGAAPAALSENNIGVASEDGALKVKLAKDIQGISSLTTESGVKIDAAGLHAGNKKVTGVADGTADSDAVNFKQLKNLDKKMTGNTNAIAANKADIAANKAAINSIKTQDGVVAPAGTAKATEFVKGTTVYDYLHGNTISLGKDSAATGMNSIAIGFGNQVTGKGSGAFGDPTTITGNGSYSVGNGNTISGDNTFVLGSNVNTSAKNAVVLGNNSEGADNAVSVGAKGSERQIKNVADGTADSDAVTVRQLNKAAGFDVNTIDADLKAANNHISSLDNRLSKVGAGAAALAALHPMDLTDDKWSVAAGLGHYKNANAAAVGLFYRPSEAVLLSVGGAFGGGENMLNAGVSVAVGSGTVKGTSGTMAKRVADLEADNENLRRELEEIKAMLKK